MTARYVSCAMLVWVGFQCMPCFQQLCSAQVHLVSLLVLQVCGSHASIVDLHHRLCCGSAWQDVPAACSPNPVSTPAWWLLISPRRLPEPRQLAKAHSPAEALPWQPKPHQSPLQAAVKQGHPTVSCAAPRSEDTYLTCSCVLQPHVAQCLVHFEVQISLNTADLGVAICDRGRA